MFIQFENITVNVLVNENQINRGKTPLIFLHGFSGSAEEWKDFFNQIDTNYLPLSIDLTGHGKSSAPAEIKYYTVESLKKVLFNIINYFKFEKIVLVGYSLGGRLALSFAVQYPELIEKLILESATAGIKSEAGRIERIEQDEKLAAFILENGIGRFVEYWLSLPLFDTLKNIPAEKYEHLKSIKLMNNKTGLANMLKGFGTGKMPPLWNRLDNFTNPTLLITGGSDKKFTAINQEMAKSFPNAYHKIVLGSGHNVHIEKSEDFIILVNGFLSKKQGE